MKSDCFVPDDPNMYTDLNVHRAPISAIDYLENKYVKTKAYMIDVEHYDIHEKIAKEYLSCKKTLDKKNQIKCILIIIDILITPRIKNE